MEYVIRILDRKGKLRNERFIFSLEYILDKNTIFEKLLKENNLGQKFLDFFLKQSTKANTRRVLIRAFD